MHTYLINVKTILLSLCLFSALQAEAKLTVTATTCDMREGLVVTEGTPRLGWRLSSDTDGARQEAYQIMVFSETTGKEVLNTKKTVGTTSQRIPVTLQEGAYFWKVRVWDSEGKASRWSAPGRFIIQSPQRAFGNAQWVGAITKKDAKTPEGRRFTGKGLKEALELWDAAAPLSRRSIYVANSFSLRKGKIRSAVMNVCGLGFYEARINGEKVGESEFAPLWSDYDKSVFYNTYDITDLLLRQKGQDANVEVLLGNGFYNEQGGRYHKLRISFGPPTLKMRIAVYYDNGESEDFVTDGTWKYSLSEITLNSIYGGEDYDARIPRQWNDVVIQEGPKGVLRPQTAPPVKIMERYQPIGVKVLSEEERKGAEKTAKHEIPEGAFVLDMGQNMSGIPEIRLRGKKGQQVTVYLSETLTPEGACNQRMTGRQHCYIYTLKGDGEEYYRPRFAYYGFRYIQIEGATIGGALTEKLRGKAAKGCEKAFAELSETHDGKPVLTDVVACFIHNSARKVSEFECSNTLVNATHRLIDRAVRSNMQSVFTDCPHREKLGWLEQDWLNGPGLFLNYDLTGFAPQLVQDIADAQRENGSVPTTAPEYVVFEGPGMDAFAESPEWGGTFIMMPWMYYEYYGDDSLLRRYYGKMAAYVDYLAEIDSCGILSQGLGDWYDYGDFRSGFSRNTSVPLVSTAHFYRWTKMMSEIAGMMGFEDDAERFALRAGEIRRAWQKAFGMRHGDIGTDELLKSQTGMAIALNQRLIDDADRTAVLNCLIRDIESHGWRLTTGDVGNRYLYEVLCEENRQDVLYRMLNHYDVPGYGFQIKKGMTTLTEQWDPANGSSMNHFMMGQIDGFHFTSLAGINIRGSHVVFRPQPVDDISWVRAQTETPYGIVKIEWHRDGEGKISAKCSVPVGMTYEYVAP